MHRPVERSYRHRPALRGRLDSLSHSWTEFQKRERVRQRRFALLRLGRSVRYPWARQKYSYRHRQRFGFADGAGGWKIRGPARALSARILREGDGRPRRRFQVRLERQRRLDNLGYPHGIPQRDGKRNEQQGGSFPDAARSVSELETIRLLTTPYIALQARGSYPSFAVVFSSKP